MAQRHVGGRICQVDRDGLGWKMGVRPGDTVLAVNGQPVSDVIDFRFFSADPSVALRLARGHHILDLSGEREYGESLGIQFAHPTFDTDIRRCGNHCPFCFVAQTPANMRRTLYIKDDDFRYSFLFGHFVTLTNLSENDWERIATQRLSPLYLSVHATEPALRSQLLGHTDPPDVLEQLGWLRDNRIEVHTQLVLVPGINDGPHLERSLQDLMGFVPTVASVSVVPVGLTGFSSNTLRPYTHAEAGEVLDQVRPWRESCRDRWGMTLVYPSDEWYLLAGRPLPRARDYDDFGQLENGVGVVREFLSDWARLKRRFRRKHIDAAGGGDPSATSSGSFGRPAVLVCGRLGQPVLEKFVHEANALLGSRLRVLPVDNDWFGRVTTVSGLLTARDVLRRLDDAETKDDAGEVVLVPRVMFDNAGLVTLDDLTLEDLRRHLRRPVHVAQLPNQVFEILSADGTDDDALSPKPGWWGEQNRPFWRVIEEFE